MQKMAPRQLSVRLSVILAAVFVAFLLIGGPADAEGPPPPTIEYVVASGDTLWAIAANHVEEGGDVRAMIREIMEASDVSSSSIQTGQVLNIPSN